MAGFNRAVRNAVSGLWATIGFPAQLARNISKRSLPYSAEASVESTRQAMRRVYLANKQFMKLPSDEKRRYVRRFLNIALESIESLRFQKRTQEQHDYFNSLVLEFSNARTKRDKIYSTMHPLWFIRQLQYALYDPDAPLYRVYQQHLAGLAVEPPKQFDDQIQQLFTVDLPRFRRIEVNGMLLKDNRKIVDSFLLELETFLNTELRAVLTKGALFIVKVVDGKLTWLPDTSDDAMSKNAAAITAALLRAIRAKAHQQIWQDAAAYIERAGNLEYAIKNMLAKGFAISPEGMCIDDAFMSSLREKVQTEFLAYPVRNEIHATVQRAQARGLTSVTEPRIMAAIGMLNQTPLNHFIETACANQFAMQCREEHGEAYNGVFTRACKVKDQAGHSINDDGMDFVINDGVFDLQYATPLFGQKDLIRSEQEDATWHNGASHVELKHETIIDFNKLKEQQDTLDMLPGGFKQKIHMFSRSPNIKVGIHHSLRDHLDSLQDIAKPVAEETYEFMGPHATSPARFVNEPEEAMTFRQKVVALLHTLSDVAVGLLHKVLSFIADCIVKQNVLSTEEDDEGIELESFTEPDDEDAYLTNASTGASINDSIPTSTSICCIGGSCGALEIEIPKAEAPSAPITPLQNKLRNESLSSFEMLCTSDEEEPPHMIQSWTPDEEPAHGITFD